MDYARQSHASGYQVSKQAFVPNNWQGESDCVVGPFSSKTVAEYYVSAVVNTGEYQNFEHRIFAKADSWFVEVQ